MVKLILTAVAVLLSFASLSQAQQSVIISEFLADNSGGLTDEDGDSPDWIELYNSGTTLVNLAGWYLTDDTNDLTKWSFPATNIAASSFMTVFASGKDRRAPGAPLHTSFAIDAGGGYLALVRPDGVTIATEFLYPAQRANFSYGLAQSIVVTPLITNRHPVRLQVPTSAAVGNSWLTNDFNDATWQAGTNGVGYETTVPGFAVRNFKAVGGLQIDNLAKSETLISTPSQQAAVYSETAPVVNYLNTGAGAHFGGDRTFPGLTINADVEDFVTEAIATITIPAAGAWSFGVNSDDGFRLTVGAFTSFYDPPRGPADTIQTFNFPAAGEYPLRLVFYERGGGSEVELFAAQGTIGTYTAAFRLVGDVANGGLQVRSVPVSGGGGTGYRSFIRTDVQSQMLSNNASAFIRMPFTVNNAASFTSLTLQMRYDDGFVAYLNGLEVARRNAPASPVWNSTATAEHLGSAYEDINITTQVGLLRNGNNLLAIHGLNRATNNADFLIMAEMAEYKAVGLTNRYFTTPTPGAFNGEAFDGFVADTKFSHDRGFYETNFSVVITSDTIGATIRYTTNGSAPTATSGFIYSAPIPIAGTTTLRAAAFKTGLLSSDVDTHTYIFLADVIRQSPTGARPTPEWPLGSVNSQVIDYGMDPDIVNNAIWGPMLKDSLTSIPTFSIVTDLAHLFNPSTGIYANPSGDERTWERPTSFELIHPDGSDGFQINAGLRIRGGFSRDGSNPKHAFRLFFRQEYGASKLNYPIVGPDGADQFDKIDLRTFQNYSWAFQNDARMIGLRDQFSRDAQTAMGRPTTRGNFFHLYVNGQYWGVYNTEERSEASYGETYFGGRAEDYDAVKVDPDLGYNIEPTDGNLDAWRRLWDAAVAGFVTDAAYFRVQGLNVDGTPNPAYENLLDVPNLIDYMLVIIYGGNLDAPISNFLGNDSPNNWFGMRNRTGNFGGFRFFAHDSEHTLLIENLSVDRTGPFRAGDPAQGSTFEKSSPQYLWSRLAQNPEFRLLVADHIQKHFFNGGIFSTDGARRAFLVRSNEIQSAIVAESARWGDSKNATPYTRNHWVTEMNRIYGQFFAQRPAIVLSQLRADNLFPNVGAPTFSSYGGVVPSGYSLYMTNTNATSTLYFTLDGSDPRLRGGAVSPTALVYTPGTPITINFSTRVRARVRNATTWSPMVDAQFYTLQDLTKLLISEIMYNPLPQSPTPSDEFEFIEFKNTSAVTQDLSGLSFSSGIDFAFTNGTRLLPGQFFVIVRSPTSFAARYPGVPINGVFTGRLDNAGETLAISHALGGVVRSFDYNDVAPWPAAADGYGFSLVPKDPNFNPDYANAVYWRASSNRGGSPGADDPATTIPRVLVNEALTRTDAAANDSVELFNPGTQAADIGYWYLTDDVATPRKYQIAAGTMVPAGGYIVFTEAQFNSNPLSTNSFALSSMGDELYLFSANTAGELTGYSHGFSFGAANDGVTFGRHEISTVEEHFVAQSANTISNLNSLPAVGPLVIRQIMYHPPDPSLGEDDVVDEFIELYNITGSSLALFDATVRTNTWRLRDAVDFNFPTNVTVAPNSSVLLVSFDPANSAQRAAFLNKYGLFSTVPMFGPYSGKLDNSRDSVEVYKPDAPTTNGVPYILVDRVEYRDLPPWPPAPDGSGTALRRITLATYGNDPTNWTSFATLQIQVQPRDFIIRPGTNVVFGVTAIGTEPLRYQWRFNGANIPNATNSTLALNSVQASQDGNYTAVVSDNSGSIISAPGRLFVLLNPVIVEHPQSQIAFVGDNVTFTVAATGTQPFGYRWRRNGVNLTGFLTDTCTLTNVSTNQSGSYTVIITNQASFAPGVLSLAGNLFVYTDADGDRVGDAWETMHGLNPGNPGDALADADGDGVSNKDEFYDGSNATNAQSYVKLTITPMAAAPGAVLRFTAMPDRTYTLQYSGQPRNAPWVNLTNFTTATTNRNLVISNVISGPTNRFYRFVTPME